MHCTLFAHNLHVFMMNFSFLVVIDRFSEVVARDEDRSLEYTITSRSTHLAMESDVEDSGISLVFSVGLCKTSIGVQFFICLINLLSYLYPGFVSVHTAFTAPHCVGLVCVSA